MKKIASILAATAVVFSLTGCMPDDSIQEQESNTKQETDIQQQVNEENNEMQQEDITQENTEKQEEEKDKENLAKLEEKMKDPKYAKQKKLYDEYSSFLKSKKYMGHYDEDTYGKAADEILDYSYTLVNMNENKDQLYLLIGIYKKWFNLTEYHLFIYDDQSGKVEFVEGDKDILQTKVLSSGGYEDSVGVQKAKPGLFVQHKDKSLSYVTANSNKAVITDIKEIKDKLDVDFELCDVKDMKLLNKILFGIEVDDSIKTKESEATDTQQIPSNQ